MISLLLPLFAQDLLDRAYAPRSADMIAEGEVKLPQEPDFNEALRYLLRDELKDKLLDLAEDAIASSALTLLCQASPTFCNVVKHHRANANDMLQILQTEMQGLLQKLPGYDQAARAQAIVDCVQKKRLDKVPLPQALKECDAHRFVKDIAGDWLPEIDLKSEIRKLLKLDRKEQDNVDRLVSNTTIKPDAVRRRQNLDGVARRYNELREEKARNLPFTPEERDRVAALPPPARATLEAGLAQELALLELQQEVHRTQRYLEALEQSPAANEALRREARAERERLDRDLERLRREVETFRSVRETALAGRSAAEQHIERTVRSRFAQAQANEAARQRLTEDREWGSCCIKRTSGTRDKEGRR